MSEIYNGRYALADPSSGLTAFSMECGEINMFGRCTLIRTTQRDSFPIINDAPIELEVKKESNLFNVFINGAIGISIGIVLGACAVALIAAAGAATGGAALPFLIAAVPFMVASTAAICTTVGTIENDLHTGYKRNSIEFFNTLMDNTTTAYIAGATIVQALSVAPSIAAYAGTCAVMECGVSFFTKTVVPAIIKTGIGTLATAKCAFSISDIDANITHYNWLLDKIFDGDTELYEDCESLVDIMCDGIIAYGGLLPVINPFFDDMEDVPGKNNQENTKDNAGIDDIGDKAKKGNQSITDADMPDDTQIQNYSHTVNPDGADGEKAGNNKAAVSLEKDVESTIGTGQSGKGNSSYNNYNTEQWGKNEPTIDAQQWGKSESAIGAEQWGKDNQISEIPEDKENTTDDEWYEEGVVLECQIDRYSNENEEEKGESKEYEEGLYIERGDISNKDRIKGRLKEIVKKARRDDIKKFFPSGNVAAAIVDIKGEERRAKGEYKAYSRFDGIDGYSPMYSGDDKIFETLYVNDADKENGIGSFDREVDSEVKILENITHDLGYQEFCVDETVHGSVYLITERIPCPSCKGVLDQFEKMFPNVDVVVIYTQKLVE